MGWTAISFVVSGALCAATGAWVCYYLLQARPHKDKLLAKELEKAIEREKRLRAQERAGRINVERDAREALKRQQEVNGYNLNAVAHVQSCFADRRGTPRQGGLVENSRARIVFKTAKSTAKSTFPAKIAPPRLGGKKVGLFSTRTPHRPNSIGLSVVKIEGCKKRCIEISGHDLVNGTPVLDVKPYVPADNVLGYAVPNWVATEKDVAARFVEFTPEATATLTKLVEAKLTSFYSTVTDMKSAIEQMLALDIRSVHQGRGQAAETQHFYCRFDIVQIEFTTLDKCIRVLSCSQYEKLPELHCM